MKRHAKLLLLIGALAGGAILPRLSFGGADAHAIDQLVGSAKSRADHEALASHFEAEAQTLRAKADEHKKMAVTYGAASYGKGGSHALVQHCKNLVLKFEEAATENAELARLHREIAAELKE